MEVPLKLTLKELYTGTTKRLKITRRVYNKQTGKLEPKEVSPPSHLRPQSACYLDLFHELPVACICRDARTPDRQNL